MSNGKLSFLRTILKPLGLSDDSIDKTIDFISDLLFEKDNSVSEGGAVVSSPFQEIETDLDFQLSNVVEELRSRIKNA